MDYLSLIGAAGGVIAAVYAGMAYHRMRADDLPILHPRLLESREEGGYLLVLEIHPGRRPARYDEIRVSGGAVSTIKTEWPDGIARHFPEHELRSSCVVDIDVPALAARDNEVDAWFVLSMDQCATISLCNRSRRFARMIKTTVRASMARD